MMIAALFGSQSSTRSFASNRAASAADGVEDVTQFRYTLNRNARVTIAFTNKANGQRFVFRNNEYSIR